MQRIHRILTCDADTGLPDISRKKRERAAMFNEFIAVLSVSGETMLKLVPVTLAFGIGFCQ